MAPPKSAPASAEVPGAIPDSTPPSGVHSGTLTPPPAPQATQLPVPQLQDIHPPAPVGFWPPAPGWWLLVALVAAGLIALARALRRRRCNTAYRHAAQAELMAAWQAYEQSRDAVAYVQQLNQILKRAALVAFPRDQAASLTGEAWLAFLDSAFPDRGGAPQPFRSEQGRLLLTVPYRPSSPAETDLRTLHQMGLDWLDRHRRPAPTRTGANAGARPLEQTTTPTPGQRGDSPREVEHAAP